MQCISPVKLLNPDYDPESFQGISSSPYVFVPCGRCPACIMSYSQEWRIRLKEHDKVARNAFFVTLTYNDDNLPLAVGTNFHDDKVVCPSISKVDVQKFLKRLRKSISEITDDKSFKYYIVSEYGPTTLRPHYHGIFFDLPCFSKDSQIQRSQVCKLIDRSWNLGFVRVDPVTEGRISYVTKYISCITELPKEYTPPFRLISKGLGANYLESQSRKDWHREHLACYYPDGNRKCRLPRYYKDKIFDDAMKYEIRLQGFERRVEQLEKDIQSAKEKGYDNFVELRRDNWKRFERNFKKKYVKGRKDI